MGFLLDRKEENHLEAARNKDNTYPNFMPSCLRTVREKAASFGEGYRGSSVLTERPVSTEQRIKHSEKKIKIEGILMKLDSDFQKAQVSGIKEIEGFRLRNVQCIMRIKIQEMRRSLGLLVENDINRSQRHNEISSDKLRAVKC